MSIASPNNQPSQSNKSLTRRDYFAEFVKTLPQSQLRDRKGYPLRSRQLSPDEQKRFEESLPDNLRLIDSEEARAAYSQEWLDKDFNEEDPDTLIPGDEELDDGSSHFAYNPLQYEDLLGLLNVEVRWDAEQQLSPLDFYTLSTAPSRRALEKPFLNKPRKQHPMSLTQAQLVIARYRMQREQLKQYHSQPTVKYVEKRILYFDKYPGTFKGHLK